MRPFLLVTGDFVRTGGMDQCNHALATFLADRGTETHLVAHRVEEQLAAHPNVTFHRVPKPLDSYLLGRSILARRGRTVAKSIARRGGRVVVNGGNCIWPDVNWTIHLHTRYKPEIAASLPRRLKADIEFRQAATAERRALACARLVIAGSEATRRELIEDFGIDPTRIHIVDLGVDPRMFRIPSLDERYAARAHRGFVGEHLRVAFVGAIGDRRKGFDTLYAAWKELCGDPQWNVELIVVGAGFELPIWKARAAADGLSNKIRFLGFNPVPDFVAEVLRACDLMVSPTRYEGYGLAIQEAVCTGIPAIASHLAPVTGRFKGAMSDLMLQNPEDVHELVHRLRLWHSRREEFNDEAAKLSDRLRRWTSSDMAARITETIENNP